MVSRAEPVVLSFAGDRSRVFPPDLSALVQTGEDLWLGSDEGTEIARLRPADRGYGEHVPFPLRDYLDLPGRADEEIDVEGLAWSDGYLWLAGSHSRRRSEANFDPGHPARQLRRLARVKRGGNRYLLARVPLVPAEDGALVPCRRTDDGRHAARLPGGRRRNLLTDLLEDDAHLGRFLRLPGKDNGFNVEGIAVAEDRLVLGLRGPVLRGWAVLLVLEPRAAAGNPGELRLGRIDGKRRYRKLFLDLRGLGVRDLAFDGADLLILAGPTMALRSDAVVLRWRDALGARDDDLVPSDRLEPVVTLPYGAGSEESVDHPEGIALVRSEAGPSLLVVYDSPAPARRVGEHTVLADRFRL